MKKYVNDAINFVYNNAGKAVPYLRGTAGTVAVGGITGEYALTGKYDPAKWIAAGAGIWALSDALEGLETYKNEELDAGTKLRLIGSGLKTAGSAFLSAYAATKMGEDPMALVTPIGIGGGIGASGILVRDYIGKKKKEQVSKNWERAYELEQEAKNLRKERKC